MGNTRIFGSLVLVAMLAACASPMERLPKLEDVELAEDAPSIDAVATRANANEPIARPGLLGAIFRSGRDAAAPVEPEPTSVATDAAVTEALGADASPDAASEATAPVEVAAVAPAEAKPKRRGLFGLGRGFGAPEDAPQTDEGIAATPVSVAVAAEKPTAEQQTREVSAAAATPRGIGGLFGKRAARIPKSNEPDVTAGAPLAFGAVGRVCGLSKRDLGREVERFPKLARRDGYALYDTAPGSTSARAFYITGFADGCPRQVTAANVVFGAPSMHERLRYGLPADTLPSSRTDEAYKTLKSRICKVSRNAPCGASISRLERNTVFVTMYANFSGNKNWSNLLLHSGQVYAKDIKS